MLRSRDEVTLRGELQASPGATSCFDAVQCAQERSSDAFGVQLAVGSAKYLQKNQRSSVAITSVLGMRKHGRNTLHQVLRAEHRPQTKFFVSWWTCAASLVPVGATSFHIFLCSADSVFPSFLPLSLFPGHGKAPLPSPPLLHLRCFVFFFAVRKLKLVSHFVLPAPFCPSAGQKPLAGPSSAETQLMARRKAAKMLIAVVVMFGICYLPVHLLNILRYVNLSPSLLAPGPSCDL